MTESMAERLAGLIYEAIRSWQNGVMVDLDPWTEAKDDKESGPVSIAYETARAAIAATDVERLREALKGLLTALDENPTGIETLYACNAARAALAEETSK